MNQTSVVIDVQVRMSTVLFVQNVTNLSPLFENEKNLCI